MLGSIGSHWGVALGLQGISDTNMLVFSMPNCWGSMPTCILNVSGFALQWNIGLMVLGTIGITLAVSMGPATRSCVFFSSQGEGLLTDYRLQREGGGLQNRRGGM